MGKTWEEIQQELNSKTAKQAEAFTKGTARLNEWLKPVDNQLVPRLNLTERESESDPSERIRRERKYILAAALENYAEAMQQDDDLAEIYTLVNDYAEIQATGSYGDYETESKLAIKIYKKLGSYQEKLDIQALTEEGDGYSFYERQVVTANLFSYFERLRGGDLIVPERQPDEKGVYRVDGVAHAPSSSFWLKDVRQDDDAPLFAHEPNANDISQGGLGDCYLLAPLSSIAQTHPEKIREAMHDDGNGKVTVRFFKRDINDNYQPIYVTVEKVVPEGRGQINGYAEDSLWVQTFERAWAASGLYQSRHDRAFGSPVPENIDDIYNTLLEKQKNGEAITAMDRKSYPWLFDEKRNLCKWKPSYKAITGGDSAYVTQCIMGPGYSAEVKSEYPRFEDYIKDGKLDLEALAKQGLIESMREVVPVTRAGESITPQQFDRLSKEIIENGNMQLRAVYETMFIEFPVLDENGAISPADPRYMLVYQTQAAIEDELQKLSFKTSDELLQWMDISATDRFSEKVRQTVAEKLNTVLNAEACAAIKRAVSAQLSIAEQLTEIEGELIGENLTRQLDGSYDKSAKELFDKIRKGEQAGIPMTCSTKKSVPDGLVKNHAYSLCGAYKKTIDNKEFMFVKIRNPWGTRGRKYKLIDGVLHGEFTDETNGYTELELNDYLNNFDRTHIVGPSEREKEIIELEDRLNDALAQYKDITVKTHLKAGLPDQIIREYSVEAVYRKEQNGIEKPFISLVSGGPEQERVTIELASLFDEFDTPQIGAVNTEKKRIAEAAELAKTQRIIDDGKNAKESEQKDLENKIENEANIRLRAENNAKQKAEMDIRLPYIHTFSNLKNCFAKTETTKHNGSDEYYNMKNALIQMIKQMDSRDTDREALRDASEEVGRTARAYLRHCEDVSRFGVTRKERADLAKKLLLTADMFDIGVSNPQAGLKSVISREKVDSLVAENLQQHPVSNAPEDLRAHLAGMIVDKFAEIAQNVPSRKAEADKIRASKKAREAAIKDVLESSCFKAVYGGRDAKSMMKDIKKGEEAVFVKITKEYRRQNEQINVNKNNPSLEKNGPVRK